MSRAEGRELIRFLESIRKDFLEHDNIAAVKKLEGAIFMLTLNTQGAE